jgi:hypothetical protein
LSFKCRNVIFFHFKSMDEAQGDGSLWHPCRQTRSSVYSQKKSTDLCIANVLNSPKRQRMWEEKNKVISVCSRKSNIWCWIIVWHCRNGLRWRNCLSHFRCGPRVVHRNVSRPFCSAQGLCLFVRWRPWAICQAGRVKCAEQKRTGKVRPMMRNSAVQQSQ